ncbi:MAG: peptide deformylase [Cytophagia bacterium]|nr:MAG: peptide deformylase [Cytophagia bacterium]TAG44644.1 MAG: peptide deformylase [Cytophagia bacterium]TAH30697.1 MAG: peptide deformylase [Cytophagales bacterium]
MIYSIVAYGDTVLKKKAVEIDAKNTDLNLPKLVEDMYATMYEANGVGLAAPQIGMGIRLFVIDSTRMEEDESLGVKKAFINPTILEEKGEKWAFEEGCLSIPNVRENVYRQSIIKIHYFDENWNEFTHEFDKMTARVIQHEYDHIEGILFTDHLSSFKKALLKSKLGGISRGDVKVEYRMRFPNGKR